MRVDGKLIAEKIYHDLQIRVWDLIKKGVIPQLAVILVGENPASVAYVTLKRKKGEDIGAKVTLIEYPTDVTTEELAKKVEELNKDKSVHGILIQRPLPPQIDVEKLELLTDPEKDIDGFHPDSPYTLPLPLAVVKILEEVFILRHPGEAATSIGSHIDDSLASLQNDNFSSWLKHQKIVVIGKGPTGGGPIIKLLNKLARPPSSSLSGEVGRGASPTVIDSKTKDPDALMKKADIIISSVGRENTVRPEMIKKGLPAGRQGVILVGVGILRGEDGKLKGDYDPKKIEDIAGFYTPTPGGVGPVNVAMLMENLVTATEIQNP